VALAPATAMAMAADTAGFTPAMVAAAGRKRNKPIRAGRVPRRER
jgi:hypothetical protein